MLLNNFYTISEWNTLENELHVSIKINPWHEIFKGHFPEQPVVPGVCMVQIVKELLEQNFQRKLLFSRGHQIKFLQLVVPHEDDIIVAHIKWNTAADGYNILADFKKDEAVVFKLSGLFALN